MKLTTISEGIKVERSKKSSKDREKKKKMDRKQKAKCNGRRRQVPTRQVVA